MGKTERHSFQSLFLQYCIHKGVGDYDHEEARQGEAIEAGLYFNRGDGHAVPFIGFCTRHLADAKHNNEAVPKRDEPECGDVGGAYSSAAFYS